MDAKTEEISKQGTKTEEQYGSLDSASSLQAYLNSIPISSFSSSIGNTPVLEVQAGELLRDAIHKLYQKNVSVALITDPSVVEDSDTNVITTAKPSDRYIGLIRFTSMVLWCIQRLHMDDDKSRRSKTDIASRSSLGFFSWLDQDPEIKQTKVAELAKRFLWDPFFPVHLEDDTLFHIMLLQSKHKLKVVPVIERSKSRVIGFITQNDILKLLLKSRGLEWFDNVANSALSEFRFGRKDPAVEVYGDQSVSEAISALSENRAVVVAVVHRNNKELIGSVRDCDIIPLLYDDNLFTLTKKTTLEEFIKMNTCGIKTDDSIPRMDSPIVHRKTDILKNVMLKMAETNTQTNFLVDESQRVLGVITLRDIILEFAPPCLDSRIDGGGFFKSALQQTGCHIDNGTMVCP